MAFDEPALTLHYKVEGRQSYAVLLFVPSRRRLSTSAINRKGRIKLYVRRVFIANDADLPPRLRFVRGVVDSEDLPLNISREMLQNNPQVTQIPAASWAAFGELETRRTRMRDLRQDLERLRPGAEGGLYEDQERRDGCWRSRASPRRRGEGQRSLQAVRGRPQTQPDRDLLSRGRGAERSEINQAEAARAVASSPAADRSDRRLLDDDAAGIRAKPLKSLSEATWISPSCLRSTGQPSETASTRTQRSSRRSRTLADKGLEVRLAAADQRCLPGAERASRDHDWSAAGAPGSRQRRQAILGLNMGHVS